MTVLSTVRRWYLLLIVAYRLVAGDFAGEDADVVYAAVALGVVHAVADDELVGDCKAHVVGLDWDEAALGLESVDLS